MKVENVEDEVVISGIGCKLPEADSIEEFAEKLFSGENMVTQDDRKLSQGLFENLPEFSGKLRSSRKFDFTFFGVSYIVMKCMDPMTQQIMERALEAVVDAGINPAELKESNTAVYSGTSISDFDLEWATNYRGGYGIMGRNRCMNSNRVSYWLDLKGTSVSQDSMWANGLMNLKLAWESISKGRCDTAIISTANLQSNAEITIQMNDVDFLSTEGICNPFDDSANGYVRSDAVVVLVLQRASVARRIYATVSHVFAKYYGDRSNIIHRPLQRHWEDLFQEFYSQSKIDVKDICYLEGHGSGIKEEDKVELNAVTNFFCRQREDPLLIGSVKSNMGHSEASAASCGLVKAIISLERGVIPQNLHFSTPNSEACQGFQSGKLKVVDRNTPFPENGLIAVNAYSFSGVFAHVVLKPNRKRKTPKAVVSEIPRIVLLSGRTRELLENSLNKLESMAFDPEYISLLNTINSKKMDKYLGRGYTILPSKDGAPVHDHEVYNEMKRPVWFIFSGMGSQWPKMGKRLMDLPIFRESIEKCHKILEGKGLDLIKIITEDDPKMFENILHSFVGIAAIQIGLVDVLNTLQIVPDGMIGHSVGELGCAYADGCFTAEQMILSAYSRGRASIESDLIKGYMAAIGKGYNQIKDELPEGIEVACHNSADSCTISGPAEMVQDFVKELESRKVFARTVNVSNIAYHSRYIKPAAPRLLKYLKEVIPNPKLRSSKWISTSNLEENWDSDLARYCSPEYHTNNLLSSVLFEEGCKHIPSNAICIEIAPHGLLQAIVKRSLGKDCTNIPLTNRTTEDPLVFLLQALGRLFMAGLEPQVNNLYPKVEYPVSRGTPSVHQLVNWDHETDMEEAQSRAEKKVIYSIKNHFLNLTSDGVGYVINGENTYPVSVFLYLVWNIYATLKKRKIADCPILLQNFRLERPMAVHPMKYDDAMVTLQKGSGDFEINTTDLLARGNIVMLEEAMEKGEYEPPSFDTSFAMSKDEIYSEFQRRGCKVGDTFKCLISAGIGDQGWTGEVEEGVKWMQAIETLFQLQILHLGEDCETLKFPKSFQRLSINPQLHLKLKSSADDTKLTANYDTVRNIIKFGGLRMKGFKVQDLPPPKSTLKFIHNEFAPFMNPPFKDPWQYVDFCFAIVTDNIKSFGPETEVQILEVVDGKHKNSVADYLQSSNPDLKLRSHRVSSAKEVEPSKVFDLVVCSFTEVAKFLVSTSDSGLILARALSGQASKSPAVGVTVVSQFAVNSNEELLLLHKKVDLRTEPEFVTIPKNETILVNILRGLTEDVRRPVYLVGYEEPERGIDHFKKRIQAETQVPLRWIFVFQENSNHREPSKDFYRHQVRNGLETNIFCSGTWGFFLRRGFLGRPFEADLFSTKKLRVEMAECYLGFDFSRNFPELKQVEFSGRLKNNSRILGIAAVASDSSLVRDKYFSWELPESFTLEEGASIPLSYFYAYYCIVMVGTLKKFESILVTGGCTPLGMASIEVGLSIVPRVYVTVANEQEAATIRSRFPSIPHSNIVLHDDKNFNITLGVLTKGEYPEVIINQLEGEKLMTACNCLTPYGRIFHFGAEDANKNVQLGTSIFLLSTSFYSMSQEVIDNLTDAEKQQIHELMSKGIKDGVVKPLPKKTLTLEDFKNIVEKVETVPRLEKRIMPLEAVTFDEKLTVDSDCSYLIIGDETDVWVYVMRFLIRKGARKIIVSHRGHSNSSERHSKIVKKYGIVVHVDKSSQQNVGNLISEAQSLGALSAVFVVALKSKEARTVIADLDRLYRDKKGSLVVISKEAGMMHEICTRRSQCGLPTSAFVWGAESGLIPREMDLMKKLCGKDGIFRVSHAAEDAMDTSSKDQMLREILPKTVEDFCNLGASLMDEVRITKLPSLIGPREESCKELAPLIFIGGLQSDPVDILLPLAKQLMYPTACIHLPHKKLSIKKMVTFILPKIFELRANSEVFNIIGMSWGCYVAIEVAKQIEEIGGSVGLILIDCPHETLRENLSVSKSWQSDLLNIIQGLSKTVKSEDLAHDKTWPMKLNRVLASLNLSAEDEVLFREASNFIYNNFSAVLDYELEGTKLLGPMTVVKCGQTEDDKTISKMCNCTLVRSIPCGFREVATSKELREIIHGSAVSQSMSESTVHLNSWKTLEDFLIQQKLSAYNSLTADFRVTATRLKFSFTH